MKLIEYIIDRAREAGAREFFGIPGDFAIPFFSYMDDQDINPYILAHEPSLGYAADAYARLNGLSVAFVTYGAGALNMVNSIAQAYAEHSPVLVISGAPETQTQIENLSVHHKVKSFDTQIKIYDEVTCISRKISNVSFARETIDEIFQTIKNNSLPGYLEIPRDLITTDIPKRSEKNNSSVIHNNPLFQAAERELQREIIEKVKNSESPIILLGEEISRKKIGNEVMQLINHLNFPFMTSMSGKGVVKETHPNFIGTYMGEIGEENTYNALKYSDFVLILGALDSDMNTGLFSAKVNQKNLIHAFNNHVKIGFHKYENYPIKSFITSLMQIPPLKNGAFLKRNERKKSERNINGALNIDKIIDVINYLAVDNDYRFVFDVGELLFNSSRMRVNDVLAPHYYASMGFAIPAAIASCISDDKTVIAFVGDGAFQMTGLELGVIKRYGLNPIIVLLNNKRYETMCVIDKKRKVYNTPEWDYCKLANATGFETSVVTSSSELIEQIKIATNNKTALFIEIQLLEEGMSKSTVKLQEIIKKKYTQLNN